MRAVVLNAFGPPEHLEWASVDDPVPGGGQVRIEVAAAGVHLIDTSLRQGAGSGPVPRPELPAVPGREVAGVVDAVGRDVDDAWRGRRVVAHLGNAGGGYAELAVCPVEALHPIPDGLSEAAAIAMVGTGRTALGILDVAAVEPDDVVVVTAAAGGIGSLLLQAIVASGAAVIGLAGGPAKVDHVRRFGPTAAVDYRADGWVDWARGALDGRAATLLLDGVGGAAARAAIDLLGPGGRIVVYGMSSGGPAGLSPDDLGRRRLTSTMAVGPGSALARPDAVRALATRALDAAAAGLLVPALQCFPMADAAGAHRALEERATIGKVVLVA